MSDENQPIPQSPIIEAVVDIDCDLPTQLDLHGLQGVAGDALRERYPKFRQQFVQQHVFKQEGGKPPESQVHQGLGAMQFVTEDERQLIQFRPNGFSFNRLAPYGSLDEYLPEIESGWRVFLQLAQPLVVRKIGIRMINRIMMPMDGGRLDFGDFLAIPPRLPDTGSPLSFLGFLDQQMALDVPLPECSIEPDGGVSLDWMPGPNRTLKVSVGESDRMPYAWVDGTDRGHAVGRLVDGQLPPRILAEIRRFTSHDSSLRAA